MTTTLLARALAAALALTAMPGFAEPRLRDRLAERIRERTLIARPEIAMMSGRTVYVWRPPAPGKHPLVIFSHGLNGTGTQSKFLTQALADHGYLVLAPDHRDSLRRRPGRPQQKLGHPEDWTADTYRDRADDVRAVLQAVRAAPWSDLIDSSKLVLAGHSLGGYTALGLAGAWPSWKLPGVTAVLALSPYAQPFAKQKTLAGVSAPVMYMGGTRDIGVTPFLKRLGGVYDQTPGPAYLVVFESAGHFSFTDRRDTSHDVIVEYALAFLDRHAIGNRKATPAPERAGVAELRAK